MSGSPRVCGPAGRTIGNASPARRREHVSPSTDLVPANAAAVTSQLRSSVASSAYWGRFRLIGCVVTRPLKDFNWYSPFQGRKAESTIFLNGSLSAGTQDTPTTRTHQFLASRGTGLISPVIARLPPGQRASPIGIETPILNHKSGVYRIPASGRLLHRCWRPRVGKSRWVHP